MPVFVSHLSRCLSDSSRSPLSTFQFSCNLEGYAVIDGETTDSRCASISSLPLSFQSTKQKRSSGGLEPRRLQSTCDTGLTKCWVGVGKLGFDVSLTFRGWGQGKRGGGSWIGWSGSARHGTGVDPWVDAVFLPVQCLDISTNLEACGGEFRLLFL